MEYVVEAEHISAGYGKFPVLKECTLRVAAGALVGICGPNGAGKSSFLKVCLGLLRIRGGDARVLGARPRGIGYGRTLRRIGYVPQNTAGGSLPTTVREAVSIGRCAAAGLCRPLTRGDRALVDAAMEQAGIAALAGAFVQELSGGQQQRVAIARALAMEAELLLLDEPAASLDKDGKKELLALIETRRRKARVSAVVVSHSAETLAACDECYLFAEGVAIKNGGTIKTDGGGKIFMEALDV